MMLVEVELLLLRMELDNPYEAIAMPAANRNLSCSLNICWPSPLAADAPGGPDRDETRAQVEAAFALIQRESRPASAWQDEGSSIFKGWLSYTTAQDCYNGFNLLRKTLKAHGLGVNQKIRELIIPRDPG